MRAPLVSVICLCYNQEKHVQAAIQSVFNQTYKNIELIVVDDASQDGSREKIEEILSGKSIWFIPLEKNVGNCKAFNIGFESSKGEYIIDLAADDMLLPPRIEIGINDFANSSEKSGVHFSDAFISNEQGQILFTHHKRNHSGELADPIPQGDIYNELIHRYFVSPTTMMIKRQVLEELNGYDETLYFEDFDFWIRSARHYHYIFYKAPLVKKRKVSKSHSSTQNQLLNKHQESTFRVCQKIFDLNKNPQEYQSLVKRSKYEIKQCLRTLNFRLIPKYLKLISNSKSAYRRLSSPSNIEI
ncbi:MAG: glycosyltransferase [Cyclobacteriaceae bacterium]